MQYIVEPFDREMLATRTIWMLKAETSSPETTKYKHDKRRIKNNTMSNM